MTCATTARRRRIRYAPLYCLLAGAALAAPGTAAEEATPPGPAVDRSEWEDGWHVVRPGDTLEGLAARFLGSHELWRELHLLNPLVKDPNLLFPGQRLRIFLERPTAKLSAQIMAVARDVRELPTPVPWRPASAGDVLLERDALRTAKSASARLRFDDGATVTLSEDSLVFIRRQTAATSPLPKKEIEIQLGQIDVESGAEEKSAATKAGAAGARGRQRPDAIEVVVGGARSLATPVAGEPASTRSRKSGDDLAQFMVFSGKSTVSAAGATIEVPAGAGTSVAPKAPPGPVEALLPAPTQMRPAYGEEVERAEPQFSWAPVPGADHYLVEVCRDPGCGALVARAPTASAGSLQLDVEGGLPAGELFWRVTAVAASGLDGFPTAAIRIEAVDFVRPDPPQLVLEAAPGEALPGGSCFSAVPQAVVRTGDRRGAELPWTLLLDGRKISLEEFRALPVAGKHLVAARVTDSRGRTADSPQLAFTLDGAAPWVDLVALSPGAPPDGDDSSDPARRRGRKKGQSPVPTATCDAGLEALEAGGIWKALPCATAVAPAPTTFVVDPARPAVTLRTTAAAVAIGDSVIGAGERLSVAGWDVGCGVNQVALRIMPSPYSAGRMLLEAEVTDAAGNRRTQGWHVARK